MTNESIVRDPDLSNDRLKQALDTIVAACVQLHTGYSHPPCGACSHVAMGLSSLIVDEPPVHLDMGEVGLPVDSGSHILATETDHSRPFLITCGLREGYKKGGYVHPLADVKSVVAQWITSQLSAGKPQFGTIISEAELAVGLMGQNGPECDFEPVAQLSGEVSVVYYPDLPDNDVVQSLRVLAQLLRVALKQTRVYVRFRTLSGRDITLVVEADGRTSPRAT